MGCSSCSSGGCGTGSLPAGCKNNGACGVGGCGKLDVFDWLADMELPSGVKPFPFAEIRFKNTRKEFYKVPENINVQVGDAVITESNFGFDLGMVTSVGELVRIQMNKKKVSPQSKELKKLLRKATETDLEKWKENKAKEKPTMFRTRNIALELKLDMKMSDVEFQADGTKAIFYYTADDRVDFRELIKVLASEFKVRVEMKQIGSRQEAGLVGGIGSCGRELCCSTWLSDFRTVSTAAARYQQLAINPVKLAGQCGKLKCCLNYELDSYLDALKDFPNTDVKLQTQNGIAVHQKTDIFKGILWYTYEDNYNNFIALDKAQVSKIIEMNKKGQKPQDLRDFSVEKPVEKQPDYENVVGQDSLNRFDNQKKNRKKKKKKRFNKPQNPNENKA